MLLQATPIGLVDQVTVDEKVHKVVTPTPREGDHISLRGASLAEALIFFKVCAKTLVPHVKHK